MNIVKHAIANAMWSAYSPTDSPIFDFAMIPASGVTICSASSFDNAHTSMPGRDAKIPDNVMSMTFICMLLATDTVCFDEAVLAFFFARDLRCLSAAAFFFASAFSSSVPGRSTVTILGSFSFSVLPVVPLPLPVPPLLVLPALELPFLTCSVLAVLID